MASKDSNGNVKHLDTKEFSNVIQVFKDSIQTYNEIKLNVQKTTNNLLPEWDGEGQKQFEKDYKVLAMQLTDISELLYELQESLINAEALYIEADREAAKLLATK